MNHTGTRSLHVQSRLRDPDAGINGRLFVTQPITSTDAFAGPRPEDRTLEEPGAWRYGAPGEELRTAYVRVGTLSIGISPWQRIEPRGLKHLENARNKWLADRGYTGGVRTVVNDALRAAESHQPMHAATPAPDDMLTQAPAADAPAQAQPQDTIQPRATFRVDPNTPRFRKRMQVRSPFGTGNWVLAPTQSTQIRATVGPSVLTVRGERNAGVTLVLPAGTSASEALRTASKPAQPAEALENAPAAAPEAAQATAEATQEVTEPAAKAG